MFMTKQTFDSTLLILSREMKLKETDWIWDIGANVGSTSLPVATELGVGVVAVEPSPDALSVLVKNASENNVRLLLEASALVPESLAGRLVEIKEVPHNRGSNSVAATTESNGSWKTIGITPREFFRKFQSQLPKIVKIDVEGFEDLILGDLGVDFSSRQIVLLCEYHVSIHGKPSISEETFRRLRSQFEIFKILKDGSRTKFNPRESAENIILQPLPLGHSIDPDLADQSTSSLRYK